MAADARSLCFQLAKNSKIRLEKEGLTVRIVHVLRLDKECTVRLIFFLDATKVQGRRKRVFPIHIMGEQQYRALAARGGGQPHPVSCVRFVPSPQNQQPYIRAWLESVHIVALGLVIPVILTSQYNVQQTESQEIGPSLTHRVREQSCTAVVKARQHPGPLVSDISVAPDN